MTTMHKLIRYCRVRVYPVTKDLAVSDDQHASADKILQSESIHCDKKDLAASDDQHASAD